MERAQVRARLVLVLHVRQDVVAELLGEPLVVHDVDDLVHVLLELGVGARPRHVVGDRREQQAEERHPDQRRHDVVDELHRVSRERIALVEPDEVLCRPLVALEVLVRGRHLVEAFPAGHHGLEVLEVDDEEDEEPAREEVRDERKVEEARRDARHVRVDGELEHHRLEHVVEGDEHPTAVQQAVQLPVRRDEAASVEADGAFGPIRGDAHADEVEWDRSDQIQHKPRSQVLPRRALRIVVRNAAVLSVAEEPICDRDEGRHVDEEKLEGPAHRVTRDLEANAEQHRGEDVHLNREAPEGPEEFDLAELADHGGLLSLSVILDWVAPDEVLV
mmetsp:Transcript_9299/g.28816  ORF Transcript_9299/g.28816 Transcript_9299/m.28816 type:complete len:332 (+) Transcript_9299:1097-2092(+)